MNYELLWEDDDPATIAWVQEEFDALWNDSRAMDLSCCPFIPQDVQRIISRKVIEPEETLKVLRISGWSLMARIAEPSWENALQNWLKSVLLN